MRQMSWLDIFTLTFDVGHVVAVLLQSLASTLAPILFSFYGGVVVARHT